nr:extracellular ribonuclease LE-like isoform X2 [Solanum lycopersicum]
MLMKSKPKWPPALCDQKLSCYSTTGKPTLDFGVHGLRPNYDNGSYPSSCDITNLYDETKIKDLISSMQENWPTLACLRNKGTKFWSHEWDKHVTCSLSTLDEHSYFKAALTIKEKELSQEAFIAWK